MATNLVSINEASGYINDEYLGSNVNASSDSYSKALPVSPESEPRLKDDRQGRPNLEL